VTTGAIATKSPVPTISVYDDKSLARVRYWANEVDFTRCHTAANATRAPAIALLQGDVIVAGVICSNAWMQRAADNICEAVLMRREGAQEGAK
jgi:hypothetical protein